MATVKTIKPAGGGDYTTLQAWEDWADGEANADQWAECYTGGDLGGLTIASWTATPDADNYPRIYAADGEEHGGDKTAGAYFSGAGLSVATNYTQVVGLRGDGKIFNGTSGSFLLFERCLSHDHVSVGFYMPRTFPGANATITIRNCLCIDVATGFQLGTKDALGGIITLNVYNNTAYNCSAYGFQLQNKNFSAGGATINLENNIAMGCGDDFILSDTGGDGVITSNNNLSDDDTADDFGGTGHVVNQTDTDVFTDPASDDYSLKDGSAAADAGKTIAAVTDDIIGTARPQGDAYDIGAFETEAAAAAGGGSSLINTGLIVV
jgi:hypothetical protein